MIEYECYCCLCCGPIVRTQVGSSSPYVLRKRRERVEMRRLAQMTGDPYNSVLNLYEDEYDEVIDISEELTTYDPDLATGERTHWIKSLQVLGFNPEAIGPSKCEYKRGRGMIEVPNGSDPNQPSVDADTYYNCYKSENGNDVVFPFHCKCMAVLKKVYEWSLSHTSYKRVKSLDSAEIDMDSLYFAFAALSEGFNTFLDLDYGNFFGADEFWISIPGEEWTATDPLSSAVETIELPLVSTASRSLYSRVRSSSDAFGAIPNEILHIICDYLSVEDLSSFLIASFVVHCATLEPAFWKSLGSSRLPWAWDLWERTTRHESQSELPIDYKKLYFLVEARTSHPYGMTISLGDWMSLANRRRIWTACLDLLPHYFDSVEEGETEETIPSDSADAAIEGEPLSTALLFDAVYPGSDED
ncbi:unnamed protein product [Clonostachys rosea]|uniref:F-box domain-containing protein n=1 Tax=Bionectria ochroleuca TaxID=29856 RepID=A0ABY6UGL9_BIOOC|nr:unnamed protein product [Clonostachys rosea]